MTSEPFFELQLSCMDRLLPKICLNYKFVLLRPTMQQRFYTSAKHLFEKYITPNFVGHSFRVKGETWYFFTNSPLCVLI